jgi:hypothetical protein
MPVGPPGGPELVTPKGRSSQAYRLFWKHVFEVQMPRLHHAHVYARAARQAARIRRT